MKHCTTPSEDCAPGPVNLQFSPGDTFPALEQLVLGQSCYNWYLSSAAHCATWTRAMDWTCLRALDLGHATPQHLLPALTGQITGLKKAVPGLLAECVWFVRGLDFADRYTCRGAFRIGSPRPGRYYVLFRG